jgi:hypothetical protein
MRFTSKTFLIPVLSFAAGVMATALAIDVKARSDYAEKRERIERVKKAELLGAEEALRVKRFVVSIDEINNQFVFAERFEGSFEKTLTMSDGSKRTVRLKPLVHKNERVIALEDTGKTTYMGLNGTTTNGQLIVQVRELGD